MTTIADYRSEGLLARYIELTENNPGFRYDLHMRSMEHEIADADSVTSALVGGHDRLEDLARVLRDDDVFHTWRLRLDHPGWWIGGRVSGTTPLLAGVVSDLRGTNPGPQPYRGITGYIGADWVNQAVEAIRPLSAAARNRLAVALRRELLGRIMCQEGGAWLARLMDVGFDRNADLSEVFPESEIADPVDVDGLVEAIDTVREVHGAEWAAAFKTMVGDLDLITWPGLIEVLDAEQRSVGVG